MIYQQKIFLAYCLLSVQVVHAAEWTRAKPHTKDSPNTTTKSALVRKYIRAAQDEVPQETPDAQRAPKTTSPVKTTPPGVRRYSLTDTHPPFQVKRPNPAPGSLQETTSPVKTTPQGVRRFSLTDTRPPFQVKKPDPAPGSLQETTTTQDVPTSQPSSPTPNEGGLIKAIQGKPPKTQPVKTAAPGSQKQSLSDSPSPSTDPTPDASQGITRTSKVPPLPTDQPATSLDNFKRRSSVEEGLERVQQLSPPRYNPTNPALPKANVRRIKENDKLKGPTIASSSLTLGRPPAKQENPEDVKSESTVYSHSSSTQEIPEDQRSERGMASPPSSESLVAGLPRKITPTLRRTTSAPAMETAKKQAEMLPTPPHTARPRHHTQAQRSATQKTLYRARHASTPSLPKLFLNEVTPDHRNETPLAPRGIHRSYPQKDASQPANVMGEGSLSRSSEKKKRPRAFAVSSPAGQDEAPLVGRMRSRSLLPSRSYQHFPNLPQPLYESKKDVPSPSTPDKPSSTSATRPVRTQSVSNIHASFRVSPRRNRETALQSFQRGTVVSATVIGPSLKYLNPSFRNAWKSFNSRIVVTLEKLQDELDTYKKSQSASEKRIEALKRSLKNLESKLADAQASGKTAKKDLDALLKAQEGDRGPIIADIVQREHRDQQLIKPLHQLAEKNTEIDRLKKELKKAEEQLIIQESNETITMLIKAQDRVEHTESKVLLLKAKMNDQQIDLDQLIEENNLLQKTMQLLEAEKEKGQTSKQSLSAQLRQQQEEYRQAIEASQAALKRKTEREQALALTLKHEKPAQKQPQISHTLEPSPEVTALQQSVDESELKLQALKKLRENALNRRTESLRKIMDSDDFNKIRHEAEAAVQNEKKLAEELHQLEQELNNIEHELEISSENAPIEIGEKLLEQKKYLQQTIEAKKEQLKRDHAKTTALSKSYDFLQKNADGIELDEDGISSDYSADNVTAIPEDEPSILEDIRTQIESLQNAIDTEVAARQNVDEAVRRADELKELIENQTDDILQQSQQASQWAQKAEEDNRAANNLEGFITQEKRDDNSMKIDENIETAIEWIEKSSQDKEEVGRLSNTIRKVNFQVLEIHQRHKKELEAVKSREREAHIQMKNFTSSRAQAEEHVRTYEEKLPAHVEEIAAQKVLLADAQSELESCRIKTEQVIESLQAIQTTPEMQELIQEEQIIAIQTLEELEQRQRLTEDSNNNLRKIEPHSTEREKIGAFLLKQLKSMKNWENKEILARHIQDAILDVDRSGKTPDYQQTPFSDAHTAEELISLWDTIPSVSIPSDDQDMLISIMESTTDRVLLQAFAERADSTSLMMLCDNSLLWTLSEARETLFKAYPFALTKFLMDNPDLIKPFAQQASSDQFIETINGKAYLQMHEPVLQRLFSLNEREQLTILTSSIAPESHLSQLHASHKTFDETIKKLQSLKSKSPKKIKPEIPMEDRIVQATNQTTVSSLCYSCPEEALLSALSQRADLLDNTIVQVRIAQSTPHLIKKFLLDEAHRNLAGPLISLLSPKSFLTVISGNSLQMLPEVQTRLGMMEPDQVRMFMSTTHNAPFISHHLAQPILRSILLKPFDTSLQKKIKKLIKEPNETKKPSLKTDRPHHHTEQLPREYAFRRSHYQSAPLKEIGHYDLYVLIDKIRYNFSGKNPSKESSQLFGEEKRTFFYSKDNEGNYWINIADPRNAHIVHHFVDTHNHTACIQLAATFSIAMQHLITVLVESSRPTGYGFVGALGESRNHTETSYRIDDDMLDKIAPYISYEDLVLLLKSPHGTQYLDNRNLRTRVLSKEFLQHELRRLPEVILKKLSFLQPLSFGSILPLMIDSIHPDNTIFDYSLWALLELFKHANSGVIRSIKSIETPHGKSIISKLIEKLIHHDMPLDDNTVSYVVSNINDKELFDMLTSSSFDTLFLNNTVRKRALSASFVGNYLWQLPNTKIKRILLTDGPHFLQCKQLLYSKSFSNTQFYQLLMLNTTEILLVDKNIRAHCLSKHFVRKHLRKFPVAKLVFLFNHYFEETKSIIPDFLEKCDDEKCASVMALSDNFFDHEPVRAHCLRDDFVTKHLSRLPDNHIIRLLEAHPQAYHKPAFQERILSMQDEQCIKQLVVFSTRETLLERVKDMVDKHNLFQMISHPLKNPLVQRRFLKKDLIENFIELAPTNVLLRAVFPRPSLWHKTSLKAEIFDLKERADRIPDITATEREWLEIMSHYLDYIEPLVREHRACFAQKKCDIDNIMNELQDGPRWDQFMEILTLFHGTMHYEDASQDLSDHQSNLEVLGNFACLCLELCTKTDFARAVLSKQKFHYLCAILKNTKQEQLIDLAKLFITNDNNETAKLLAPLEPASSQMAYVAGILAYDVYNQDRTQFFADLVHVQEQLDREQQVEASTQAMHDLLGAPPKKYQEKVTKFLRDRDHKEQQEIRQEQETWTSSYREKTSLYMMHGIYHLLAHSKEADQTKEIMHEGWKAAITLSGNDDDIDSNFKNLLSHFPESIDKEFMKNVWKDMSNVPGIFSENSPLSKLAALKMADLPQAAISDNNYVLQVAYQLAKQGYQISLDQPSYDIVTSTLAILCKGWDWELQSKSTMNTFEEQLKEYHLDAQKQNKVFVLYSTNIPWARINWLHENKIQFVQSS